MALLAKAVPLVRWLARVGPAVVGTPPPPSPPARRAERAYALAVYTGFGLAIVATVAVLLGALALDSDGRWLAWAKLGVGIAMGLEGLLLAKDWRGARRLTLWRLRRRRSGDDGHLTTLRSRLSWRVASPLLMFVGVAWVTMGFLLAVLGLSRLA